MDLFVLDTNFQITDVVDVFNSLVWTERYSDEGDFELHVADKSANRKLLDVGKYLSTPDSLELMQIQAKDAKNGDLKVTGKSLVNILRWRMWRPTWKTDSDSQMLSYTAGVLAGFMVNHMVIDHGMEMYQNLILPGTYGQLEIIPNLSLGPIDSTPSTDTTVAVPYGPLFDAVQQVCQGENVGFSLRPANIGNEDGQLIFTTYFGRDLTSSQSVNPVVIFESALDSLSDIETLESIEGYATAAYAWANGITSKNFIGTAFVSGTAAATGFARRSLMVEASDVTVTDYPTDGVALTKALNKRAKDALVNNNYVRMVDGQVVPQSAFLYGRDYNLGDVVELRNDDGVADRARIIEYIRTQDATGERAYPTLSVTD